MAGAGSDGVRKVGVAMDYSPSSKKALDWAIQNLLRHGDTLVVLHVLHQHAGDHALWAKSGSRKAEPPSSSPECLLRFIPFSTWVGSEYNLISVLFVGSFPLARSADPSLRVPGARGDEAVRRHLRRRGARHDRHGGAPEGGALMLLLAFNLWPCR